MRVSARIRMSECEQEDVDGSPFMSMSDDEDEDGPRS